MHAFRMPFSLVSICVVSNNYVIVTLLFCVFLLNGCSTGPKILDFKIKPSHELAASANVTKANVGIFYEPNLAKYIHRQTASNTISTTGVGQESVDLFNVAIPMAFENTQVINKLPPYDIPRSEMDGIIEARLDYINWRMYFDSEDEFFRVGYTFIFYTSEGVPISVWKINGEGQYLQDQMTDAAQKFVSGFSDASATKIFRDYLETKRVGTLTFDIENIDVSAKLVESNELGLQLKEAGILPVQVTINNKTNSDVIVRGFDTQLLYSGSKRLVPAFPLAVVSATEYVKAITASDPAMVGALFGPLVMIGAMTGGHSGMVDTRKKQAEYFEKSRLKEISLKSGTYTQGIVYFSLPDDVSKMKNATLSLWFIEPSVANGARKEIGLYGIDYIKPSPEELLQRVKERDAKAEQKQAEDEFEF